MATKYGVNATANQVTVPAGRSEQGQGGGNVKSIYDSYALTADLASGDVIRMGSKIPAGARIIDVRFTFADLDASGGTVDVGWLAGAAGTEVADQDGFGTAVDVTSAGVYSMWTSQSTRPGFQKVFAEEVQAVLTTVGDTDATSGTVNLEIIYAVD